MWSSLTKRQCFIASVSCFVCAFLFLICLFASESEFVVMFFAGVAFFNIIIGILFLAIGLHDKSRDENAIKPPRFYTLNEDGNIVLTDVSTPPPLDCKETRRADGKVDISMEIHSKEQAVEVLAALAVMYDTGDIAEADYHCNVRKIREHFQL